MGEEGPERKCGVRGRALMSGRHVPASLPSYVNRSNSKRVSGRDDMTMAASHTGSPMPEFEGPDTSAGLSAQLLVLLGGGTLSAEESAAAFEEMMMGRVHHGEIGAFLSLLATRTPDHEEILGAAQVMRHHVETITTSIDSREIVDTAGTGGAPKTFNVSTAASIVAAAAGARVAKHGNRSRTGRGSAEVLQALGVNVDAGRERQERCLEEVGICFCFAIHHHPATRHVMPVRLALGFPTIFNLLGPLTNPAGAGRQILGVYEDRFVEPVARALVALDTHRSIVLHSLDGLDECSISAPTRFVHIEHGRMREEMVDPAALGLDIAPREDVEASDLPHAVSMIQDILSSRDTGPARDMVLLNAAATLLVSGHAPSMEEGLALSREMIDSGAARNVLEQLAACSSGKSR